MAELDRRFKPRSRSSTRTERSTVSSRSAGFCRSPRRSASSMRRVAVIRTGRGRARSATPPLPGDPQGVRKRFRRLRHAEVWRHMLGDGTRIARCTVGRQKGLRGVTRGKAVTTTGSDKAAPCRLTASTASSGPRRRTCCGSATSTAARAAAGLDGRARPSFRQDLRQGIAKREHSLEHFSIRRSRLIEGKCSLIEEVEHYSRSNWIGKCSSRLLKKADSRG